MAEQPRQEAHAQIVVAVLMAAGAVLLAVAWARLFG
jgi:hypothetical protein